MAIEPTKAIVPPRGVKTDYPVRLEMPLQLLGVVLIRVLSVKQLIDSDPYATQFPRSAHSLYSDFDTILQIDF